LLSGSNNGATQAVNGTTIFNDTINLFGDDQVGGDGISTVLTVESGVTTTLKGTANFSNTVVFDKGTTFNDAATLNRPVTFTDTVSFTSATADVTFTKDITMPAKSAAAAQNVTTHPASEHQVYLAASASTTELTTHKTATVIDHPNFSVTTLKIADKNVTSAKVQDITTDATSTKAVFSSGSVTFAALLSTVWLGLTWLAAKLNDTSGHKHTGGTDDAPLRSVRPG
jgi:hypothetical protein